MSASVSSRSRLVHGVMGRIERQWELLGSLLRRSSIFAIVPAVQAVSLFAVLAALASLWTPDELGELATAQLTMQLAVLIAAGGLPGLVTSEFFAGDDGPRRAKELVGFASIVVAPSTLAIVFVSGPLWSSIFENLSFTTSIQLGIVAAWPRSFVVSCLGVLRAERSAAQYATVALMSLVGAQICGVIAVVIWGGPTSFMAGVLAGNLVAALLGHALTRPELRRWRPSRKASRSLAVSIPIAVNSAAGLVVTTGDRVVIERELGLGEVGRYQIAYLLGSVGVVILLALNNAWAPAVYARTGAAQRAMLAASTRSLLLLASTIAIVLSAMGPMALHLIAPPDYELVELTGLVALVALSAVPFVFYLAATHRALVSRSTGRMALATIVAASANVVGNLVLVPTYGLSGAGAATLASYAIWAVAVQRRSAGSGSASAPRSSVIRPVGAHIAGAAVVVLAFGFAVPTDGLWLAARLAFAATFAAGGLELTRRTLVAARSASSATAPESAPDLVGR